MPEAGNGLFRLPDQGEHFGARECGHRVVVGGLPPVLQQDEGIGELHDRGGEFQTPHRRAGALCHPMVKRP
jgi:hypothetical protein